MKNKILIAIACLLAVLGVICGIYWPDSEINNTLDMAQNTIIEKIENIEENDVVVTDEMQADINETIKDVENGEDISTTEIVESSIEEEELITDEGALENDAIVEQENISYDGDNTGNGISLLGAYQGLTYYSQADSRWANVMYSSINDSSQTMKSSACGPTSAAMVVSSSKGAILPTTMASLAVSNGYRTANSGTAWSYYSFVADYFGFKEYYSTGNFDKAMNYLSQKNSDGSSRYYIIASCGSGLFTSGGHYIVLTSLDGETIQVYDPFLYNGKFNTASRKKAKTVVSGNTVYISKDSFSQYANYKNFWIFSNDRGEGNNNVTTNNSASMNYTRYVATKSSNLNVRNSASTSASKIGSLAKGTAVNVIDVKGDWSKINSPVSGWVNTTYLSSTAVSNNSNTTSSTKYITGTYRTTANIHVRIGPGTNYKIKKYNQLTSNARSQNKRLGNQYYNGYLKGVNCTVTQIKGNWGETASGWICLDYCKKQ